MLRAVLSLTAIAVGSVLLGCQPARSPYDTDYALPTKLSFPVERYQLANGMEVILSEDRSIPYVTVDLAYHAGSKDDPPGRAGLAHLVEHVMIASGTPNMSAHRFLQEIWNTAGARECQGTTNRDRTWYYETVPSNQLELVLLLESDRLAHKGEAIAPESLERDRASVKNELRQHYEDKPYGFVRAHIGKELFPNGHPYGHETIGTIAELNAVTPDDVRAFFRTFYVPSNATLVLAGSFNRASAKKWIAKYFEPIFGGQVPVRPNAIPSSLTKETRVIVEASVPRNRLVVSWPIPAWGAPGNLELQLGAKGLGDYLRYQLMNRQRLAASVDVEVESSLLAGAFHVVVDLVSEKSFDDALVIVDGEIRDRGHWRMDRVNFAVNRASWTTPVLYKAETSYGRAELLHLYNDYAGTPDFVNREFALASDIYVEDVRDAIRDLISEDRRVVTFVRARPNAPRAGKVVSVQ